MEKNVSPLSRVDANYAAVNYLKLKDEHYTLDLSKEQAQELGISAEDFTQMQTEIEQVNKQIAEWKKDPEISITLTDPQGESVRAPGGVINTNGQEEGSASFFAPYSTTRVKFDCTTNVVLAPLYTCRTRAGGVLRTGTAVGVLGKNTTIYVVLAYSNVNATASFQTSDKEGGKCAWEAVP